MTVPSFEMLPKSNRWELKMHKVRSLCCFSCWFGNASSAWTSRRTRWSWPLTSKITTRWRSILTPCLTSKWRGFTSTNGSCSTACTSLRSTTVSHAGSLFMEKHRDSESKMKLRHFSFHFKLGIKKEPNKLWTPRTIMIGGKVGNTWFWLGHVPHLYTVFWQKVGKCQRTLL